MKRRAEPAFAVRETYPVELAKQEFTLLEVNNLKNILKSGKDSDPLRKLLLPHFEYGPNLLEHLCLERGIALSTKLKAGWRKSGYGIFKLKFFAFLTRKYV